MGQILSKGIFVSPNRVAHCLRILKQISGHFGSFSAFEVAKFGCSFLSEFPNNQEYSTAILQRATLYIFHFLLLLAEGREGCVVESLPSEPYLDIRKEFCK